MPFCATPNTSFRAGHAQGQRISISLNRQDFRKELRVHHAPNHLAAEAVFDRMALEKRHCEASQPAQIVAECSFTCAAVVLAKIDIQHPVHRLDAPMTANCLTKSLAAEVTAENVVSRLVRFAAVSVLRNP